MQGWFALCPNPKENLLIEIKSSKILATFWISVVNNNLVLKTSFQAQSGQNSTTRLDQKVNRAWGEEEMADQQVPKRCKSQFNEQLYSRTMSHIRRIYSKREKISLHSLSNSDAMVRYKYQILRKTEDDARFQQLRNAVGIVKNRNVQNLSFRRQM